MNFPISEIADHVIEMDLVWGNLINDVREQLAEVKPPAAKFKLLEQFLVKQLNGSGDKNQIVDFAVDRILRPEDEFSIRSLTDELGISHKHLVRLFDSLIGLTPKQLARIVKFQKVLQLVEQEQQVRWTEIAHECGYYDQAHFIRDFKTFTGMSPTEYLAQKRPYINYVILD